MGVAFFPVLEREIEGLDISFDGKMLARLIDKEVERRALLLGFEPIMNFFGYDPEWLEEFDVEANSETTEKWFAAEDGLKSVTGLRRDLEGNPGEYSLTERERLGAIEDSKRLAEILDEAARLGVRWYLAIDF
jgi:hypothetical protein